VIACASVVAAAAPLAAAPKLTYEQHKNIVYGEVDGVGLVMDVFTPTGAKNGIGIIDVASGGWHSDRGKIEDHRLARFYDIFCGRGYTVFAIRPGSVSKFTVPEMVKNLRTGIKWVRSHAKEYGIDPDNLGISGASAGGHLTCLTVVTTPDDPKNPSPFKAVAVFFPPTDFLMWGKAPADASPGSRVGKVLRSLIAMRGDESFDKLTPEEIKDRVRQICPARLVNGKQPPFLLIHGDADPIVPLQQSECFCEALKKNGGSAELIVKPGGTHPWLTIHEEVKAMADWFDKQLQPKRAS
jgi:acetyl esterase/lipase